MVKLETPPLEFAALASNRRELVEVYSPPSPDSYGDAGQMSRGPAGWTSQGKLWCHIQPRLLVSSQGQGSTGESLAARSAYIITAPHNASVQPGYGLLWRGQWLVVRSVSPRGHCTALIATEVE